MDSLVQMNLHFSEELQWFRGGHGFFISSSYSFACVYAARCMHYAFWIFAESAPFSYTYAKCEVTRRPWDRRIGVKSASSPPRPKTAPRGSKSTTFAKGIFQLFNVQTIGMNPIGVLPFYLLHLRYTYKTELKFEKLSQLEVGVLSVAYRFSYPFAWTVNFKFRNLRFNHRGM